MRIFLPDRIPLSWATLAAGILMLVQIFEGTHFTFAVMHFCYVLLWVLAFNLAGGFSRTTGAYVFWVGMFTLLLGTVLRAMLGDAGDARSVAPDMTMLVYTVSMAALVVAVVVSRWLMRNVHSIAERLGSYRMDYRNAALGCLLAGMLITYGGPLLASLVGVQVLLILIKMNMLLGLAIILGTIDAVQESGGKRSVNWISALAFLAMFFFGILSFSKEWMFTPFACYLIGIAYTRYRLGWLQIIPMVGFVMAAQMVLYPMAQFGRFMTVDHDTFLGRVEVAVHILENIGDYHGQMVETGKAIEESGTDYFSRDMGLATRFTRWPGDDMLVAYTAAGHTSGYGYMEWQVINMFPHIIFPNKDALAVEGGGNFYAREVGILPPDDVETFISFGPAAESFHIGGWVGVCILEPVVWLVLFFSIEFLFGDVRRSPWGLFYAVYFSHMAPEKGIAGVPEIIWMRNVGMLACMWFAVSLAPVIGSAVMQRGRTLAPSFRLRSRLRSLPEVATQSPE